jgi:hypothetical protein
VTQHAFVFGRAAHISDIVSTDRDFIGTINFLAFFSMDHGLEQQNSARRPAAA